MNRVWTIAVLLVFLSLPTWGLAEAQSATVTLAWDAYSADQIPLIQGFKLYRSETTCALTPPAPILTLVATLVNPLAVTMGDNVLTNGSKCYEMTAFGVAGESIRSNRAEATVKILPNKPGNVRIVVTVTP